MDRELRAVLERHLSRINVDAILRKVYQAEKIRPASMTVADLERIYQNSLFNAVRMFCDPKKLTSVMLELADLIENIPYVTDPPRGDGPGGSSWKSMPGA